MNNTTNMPVMIPASKLHPFEGHPYKVRDDEEMNHLTDSVMMQGVLSPLIVRPLEGTKDEYEIVSGHRRFRAAVKAGMDEIPAFIRPMSRDEAAIALVDSNLHREHILPSEKAFAYKLKMEAMKHQGISSQLETKRRSDEILGVDSGESRAQVQRYIRLTYLIPELLKLVDEGRIALTPAVELSFLTREEQYDLLETMRYEDCTPSLSQAQQLKKLSQAGCLDMDAGFRILTQPKPNQKEYIKIQLSDKYDRYLGKSRTPKAERDFVERALSYYSGYLDRQRQSREER